MKSGWWRETLKTMQLHYLPSLNIWKKVRSSPTITDLTFIMVEFIQVTAVKYLRFMSIQNRTKFSGTMLTLETSAHDAVTPGVMVALI